ncbi:MAG TPA: hypothetical protein VHL85_11710 [Burkholderiales bacterium]|nr:hypothetical protein [Burkholderiales bacterium]
MSLPAGAAGTNEKTPDSAATGATGTGSNAMSGSATDKSSASDRTTGAGSNVSGSSMNSTNAATGASATAGDTNSAADADTTHAKKSKRKVRRAKRSPDAAQNHGAVGGESAGKSSDSPAQ